MKNEEFDRWLSEVRSAHIEDRVVSEAGERVWKSIGQPQATAAAARTLRTCEDFQALIPGYLAKQLAPSRALLFEDHLHACVACRHALEQAREDTPPRLWRTQPKPRRATWIWPSLAGCGALAVVAVIVFALANGLVPGQHPVRAAIASVDGSLYAVSGEKMRVVPAGYQIGDGEEVRTAKGSTAVVRLLDGSLVEMGERAEVAVSRAWKGTTIRLNGGQVIVQAAKQRSGRLYVATDDCQVSVKGTVFSVNRGIKGSRVAVIEGVVRLVYGDKVAELRAGQQATSNPAVSQVPIQNEIAWSRNAAKYLALMGDFAVLQKKFAAIPAPGLRYSSELLPYVPENTVVYAAIPNLSNTLSEAERIFQDQLQQSPALRTWWKEQQKGTKPKLADVLEQLKRFSSYLGDEVVFAGGKLGPTYTPMLVLAKVRQPGLEEFLTRENRQITSNSSVPAVRVVRDPWAIAAAPSEPLLLYVTDGVLIGTHDGGELQRAAARLKQGRGNSFSESPLYQQITHAYEQGVEWLFCADMEQIFVKNVHVSSAGQDLPPGMSDVRFLTMEHRDLSGKPESRAVLSFASERQGVASWLAAPASIGSLEFISPEASMVTSAVIKNPRSIMEEIFGMIGSNESDFSQHLAEFEARSDVNVLDDLAAPLGGEVTMAFDGPVLPSPRWKLVVEVYDPTTLRATIAKLIDAYNRESRNSNHSMRLSSKQVGSQTYYIIGSSKAADSEIAYTFVDNYLIAAPDVGTIRRAIQTRQAGYTLTHSTTFQSLLPNDAYTNFSGIFYHNLGPVVGPLAEQLKSSGAVTPQQQQSIDALMANSAPGLIYAYGEPSRIVVASNTGFMGFNLGTLFTMGHNGPFLPQMMLGGVMGPPPHKTQ